MFKSTSTSLILLGVASAAIGVLLFARPGVGAITLALLLGLFSLIYGTFRITLGIHLRQLHQQRRSAQPPSTLPMAA